MKSILKENLVGVLYLVLGTLLPWEAGPAEGAKRISIGGIYDNNAYGSYAEKTDYITQVGVYLAGRRGSEGSEIEYYYSGNGNLFAQSGTRTFAINRIGVAYARQLGEGRSGFTAGGSFSLRLDRSYYDVYDYFGARGYINGKWYVRPSVLLRLGYRLRLREYWNLDEFSYTEHYLFAQVSKFLPTRTTLRGDISFGYKDHRSPERGSFGYGPGQGGRGRMWSAPSDPVDSGVPGEGQVVLALQVAQSLAENTGLSLRYQTRLNTTSTPHYVSGEKSAYSEDEDIFNDRYDYEGHEWTARLTQQLPGRVRAVLGGGYEIRNYDGRPALDLLGEPTASGALREDRSAFGSISVERPLTERVTAGVWYGFERNRSNDPYYDYNGRHSLSVGFDIRF